MFEVHVPSAHPQGSRNSGATCVAKTVS